jgi:hypothetical protein
MKHNDNLTDEEYGLLEKVREELYSTINENQLSL